MATVDAKIVLAGFGKATPFATFRPHDIVYSLVADNVHVHSEGHGAVVNWAVVNTPSEF